MQLMVEYSDMCWTLSFAESVFSKAGKLERNCRNWWANLEGSETSKHTTCDVSNVQNPYMTFRYTHWLMAYNDFLKPLYNWVI